MGFSPCWLDQLDGETTPWYPGMTRIRQQRPGEWDQVFDMMAHRLKQAVIARRVLG